MARCVATVVLATSEGEQESPGKGDAKSGSGLLLCVTHGIPGTDGTGSKENTLI